MAPYQITQILNYKICNNELLNLNYCLPKKYRLQLIKRLERFLINIYFVIKRIIHLTIKKINKKGLHESWHFPTVGKSRYWPMNNNAKYSFSFYEKDPIINFIHTISYTPNLSKNNSLICKNKLNEFSIDIEKKFICLHVRDEGFHSDGERRAYRNANIENYYSGINYLLDAGYIIFRIGDNKMKKMNLIHKNFVDYPFTSLKSEIMDLYLIKNCSFYVGMQSGMLDVAQLFLRPILILNMYSWFYSYPFKTCDRGILKDVTFDGKNKLLKLNERFALSYKYTNEREILDDEIKFIENNPMQILNAIKKFLFEFESDFKIPPDEKMINDKKLFVEASRNIMQKPDQEFIKMPLSHLARITLRNLSSNGYLY